MTKTRSKVELLGNSGCTIERMAVDPILADFKQNQTPVTIIK